MNILFTLCGRAGSKGVKNKNVKDFLGHPLPYYSLSAIDLYLRKYKRPEDRADLVLSTDSGLLKELMKKTRLEVDIIDREEELSGDTVSKKDVIQSAMYQMEEKKAVQYDIIVDLDITSPLRTCNDVARTIEQQSEGKTDIVFTVTESRRNPYFNMVTKKEAGYQAVIESTFTARQQAPDIYDMNASIYAYSRPFLVSDTMILKGRCGIVTMMDTGILDIDSENDFELMQVIADYTFKANADYGEVRENISKIIA